MEHVELCIVNVGFCIVHISSKWIQLQYRGKCYSNLELSMSIDLVEY